MKTPRQTLSLLLSGLLVFSSIPASAGNALKSALDGKSTPDYHWRQVKSKTQAGVPGPVYYCYSPGFFLGQQLKSALSLTNAPAIECQHWVVAEMKREAGALQLTEIRTYDEIVFAELKEGQVRLNPGPPYNYLLPTDEVPLLSMNTLIRIAGPSPAAVAANNGTGTGTNAGTGTGTKKKTAKKKTPIKKPVTTPANTTTTTDLQPGQIHVRKPIAELGAAERAWLTFAEAADYDKKIAAAKAAKPADPKTPAEVAIHDAMKPVLLDFRKKVSDNLRKPTEFSNYNVLVGKLDPPATQEEYQTLVGGYPLLGSVDKSEIELTADEMAKVNASAALKADYQAEMLGVDPKDLVLRHRVVKAIRAKLPKPQPVVKPDGGNTTPVVVADGPLTPEEIKRLTEAERIAYTQSVDAINKNKDLTPEQKTAAIDKLAKEYRQNSLADATPYKEPKSEADFDALTPAQKSKFCNEKWTSTGGAGGGHNTKAIDQAHSAAGGNEDGTIDGNARGGGAVDPNAGGGGGSSWIDKKCREHMGAPDRRRGGGSGNLVGKIPPIGKDTEKSKKEEGLPWAPDIKAGMWGGIIGLVLACTLAPWSAPLLVPALIGLGSGVLLAGGISRGERAYAAKKKKEKDG